MKPKNMRSKSIIFISSTYDDLKKHREHILHSFASLKQQVEAMEYWGPSSETPLEYSLNRLADSTIYLGIIGSRYGTITECGKSITQLEYEEAEKLGIERFIYIIDEDHPIPLKYIDRDESFQKLNSFKQLVSHSVRGRFTSSGDLTTQVVTHLLQHFSRIGENVIAAFNQHGIKEFLLKTGYSFSMMDETIDISPFIKTDNTGTFSITDSYVAAVTASAIIAKNLVNGNYEVIGKFVSFTPEVYRLLPLLMKDLGVNETNLANAIKKCTFPATLRLLIAIAGEIRAVSCADAICRILLSSKEFHQRIKSYDLQITPFNDIIKIALSKMPQDEVSPIIQRYINIAKNGKVWQAKKALEWALKKIDQSGASCEV